MAQRQHIIGTEVRDRREGLGIHGRDFSSRIGISESYLSRIENGIRRPRPPVIARIARELGVTVEEITALDDEAAA